MPEEMLTIKQIAEELHVHYETVRGWIQSGELVALDIGRGYRISRTDLNDFIQRRKTGQKRPDDSD